QPFTDRWQPAPEVGPGVFKASVDRKPRSLLLDGKFIAELDEKRAQDEGAWHWKKLLATGTPKSGFRFIRAVWMHRDADKASYLHLADDVSPEKLAWTVVWKNESIITLRGAKGAVVRGLTLAHGYSGVILRDQCSRCTVTDCLIGPWDKNG